MEASSSSARQYGAVDESACAAVDVEGERLVWLRDMVPLRRASPSAEFPRTRMRVQPALLFVAAVATIALCSEAITRIGAPGGAATHAERLRDTVANTRRSAVNATISEASANATAVAAAEPAPAPLSVKYMMGRGGDPYAEPDPAAGTETDLANWGNMKCIIFMKHEDGYACQDIMMILWVIGFVFGIR